MPLKGKAKRLWMIEYNAGRYLRLKSQKTSRQCAESECSKQAVDGRRKCKSCLEVNRKATSRYKVRNPKKKKDLHLRYTFGITLEEYNRMLKRQDGRCWICRRKPERVDLAVDHDHLTKKNRGLLCNNCNAALGMLKDSVVALKRAIKYLKQKGVKS